MGQGISSAQFFVYGKRHFTETGYSRHIEKYTEPVQKSADIGVGKEGSDGVNLRGKVIIVTGANSGIGQEIATYAAAKGASVYMVCRSKDRAETARDEIVNKTSNDKVKILLADVGELSQVRKAAEDFQSQESKLDCIVCNAGVLLNERNETSEGNEATIASHLIGGSYFLPELLYPQLKAAGSESRVVFVTSGGMLSTPFPPWEVATSQGGNKKKYNGTMAYAYAKRGQVLLAEQWSKLHPEVAYVTGHPGWTGTAAVDAAFGESKKYLQPMRPAWHGAEGLTWLMSTKRDNLESGGFYLDRTLQKKHLSGLFMTEGSFTKNTENEVEQMMENLKKTCGL